MTGLPLLRGSLFQLRTNPLRTMLTLLGVVFGVASVVAMMSIGEGAQREILSAIEAMGANVVHIQAKKIPPEKVGEFINDSVGLNRSDLSAVEGMLSGVRGAGYRKTIELKVSDLDTPVHAFSLLAVSEDMPRVHDLRTSRGRLFLRTDHVYAQRVAVLGADLAERLFPDGAVGRRVRLNYAFFEIVGVLARRSAAKGDLPVDSALYNKSVLVPFETALAELEPAAIHNEIDLVSIRLESTEATLPAKRLLASVLRKLHGGIDDYEVVSPEEILQQRKKTQAVFNLVLISIAAISLLVGGIGVMNIMLANIMERFSEIGLRRAIGARRMDIRRQFLIEAVVICLLGGIAGLLVGLMISVSVAWLGGLPVAFAWGSMVLAFLLSTSVGVAFGLMPAIRAANISPIEALQHD